MSEQTYVMPEPQVKVVDGEFRFTGQATPIDVEGRVLGYLKAAGVYNSEADIWNGTVYFNDDFSIAERLEGVDQVLAIIDGKRLEKDLNKKEYAFLMAKGDPGEFKDYKNKGFIARTDRVIQDLIYQKIPKEFELDFNVRHFKAQESVELMLSDESFKVVAYDYWLHNLEVLQKLAKQKTVSYTMKDGILDIIETESEALSPLEVSSVRSSWGRREARPFALADRPLYRSDYGVAALKKVPSAEE